MSTNVQHRRAPRPALGGDAQLELVRRYARILRSAPAESARFKRVAAPSRSQSPRVIGERRT